MSTVESSSTQASISSSRAGGAEERILVLAPTGRDATLACTFLAQAGLGAAACSDMEEVCRELSGAAGALLVAEESLTASALRLLTDTLAQQPPWSDIPVLVLTGDPGDEGGWRRLTLLDSIGNATLVERPVRMVHLLSAVQMALRSRRRQYETAAYLAEREGRERAAREAARLEQALRAQATAAREDMERMLASIRDGFMIVNRAWRFTYVNEQAAKIAGLHTDDMIGKSVWELFPDLIGSRFYQEAQRSMAERQPASFDYYYPPIDRWLEYRLYPQPQGLVILETDITDRKHAEEHRAQLAAVVEASANGITSQTLDGMVLSWNPGAERMYGYTAEEALGRSIYMVVPHDRAEELAELLAQVRTGGRVERVETERLRRDGSVFPVELSLSPILDRSGRAIGLATIETDVSDRVQAAQALRESEERYRNLIELSPDAMFVELDGKVAYANRASRAFFGVERIEDAIGLAPLERIHPDYREIARAEVANALRAGTTTPRMEQQWLLGDGQAIDIEVAAAPFQWEGRTALHFVVHDISKRKRAEEALRRSEAHQRSRAATLQAIMEAVPATLLIAYDSECREIVANRAGYEAFRIPYGSNFSRAGEEADAGPAYRVLQNGVDIPLEDLPLQSAARTGVPKFNSELELVFPDGRVLYHLGNAAPLLDEQGRAWGAVGAFVDITERKRVEDALRESEARERARLRELESFMEAVPAIVLFAHDPECSYITANRAGQGLLRLLPGHNASRSAPGDQAPTHFRVLQQGRELAPSELPLQVAAGQGVEIRHFEEEIQFEDGTRLSLFGNAVPLFDETGKPRGGVAAFVDISERKRTEEALRASEWRYRYIFDTAAVGILEQDFSYVGQMLDELRARGVTDFAAHFKAHPDLVVAAMERVTVRDGNRVGCALWGAERLEDLCGPLARLFLPEALPAFARCLTALAAGEMFLQEEAAIRTLPGETREVLCTVSLQSFNAEDLRRVLMSVVDITERKKAERAVQASEARYRYIFEAAATAILEIDASRLRRPIEEWRRAGASDARPEESHAFFAQLAQWLRVVSANPQALALYETNRVEALNPIARLFDRATLRIFGECLAQIAEGVRYYEGEAVIQTIEGNRRNVLFTVSLPAEPENLRRVLVSMVDVTERMRAEAAIRKSEANLARAQAIASIGSWEWNIAENRMTFSEETFRILGRAPSEVTTRYPQIIDEAVHPKDHERLKGAMAIALKEPANWSMEIRLLRPDGSERIAQVRAEVQCEDGMPARMVGTLQDITDRKRAEEALRLSEARLRTALKGVPVIVFHQDPELRYTWIHNPSNGLSAEQIVGKRDADLLPAEEAQRLTAFKQAVLTSGQGARGKFRLHPGDAEVEFDLIAEPLRNGRGEVVGITCAAIDITEHTALQERLRRQAEQLTRMDQRKNEFLAVLAHELRNPLAPIHNAVHVLKIQPDPPDRKHLQWALDVIARQVQHLVRLVDDLLDIARITHGRIRLKKEVVDLQALLSQAVEAARPVVAQRHQHLAFEPLATPLLIEGDPTRLAQILGNLLNNAARYTPPDGRIALAARREGDEAVITVRDNGQGISADMLTQIFDLFSQGPRPSDDQQGGLGLGLALVHRLVELHGGTVTAASPGLGKGTTFTVRLPALPASVKVSPTPAAGLPGHRRSGMRVLVVDDNHDVAESFAVLLDLLGHRVEAVGDGNGTLAAVKRFQPDVVFLDIGLPDIDGYEVARRIRAADLEHPPRLVALTGYGQEEVRRRLQAVGFDAHLLKPATVDTLETLLASFRLR